jgi:DNA-binding transcriptional LysR family regulator
MTKDLSSVDLNLLVLLEALYEERNLTRAAARIGVGQPSASKALERLRSILGDELFVRVPGGMRPTRRAVEIEPGLRRALSEIRNAVLSELTFDPALAKGTVRLATSDIVTLTFLPEVLARLHDRLPGVDVRIRNLEKEQAYGDLDAGRVDFVIGVFDDPPKRFMTRAIIRDRFAVIASKDVKATKNRISLKTYLSVPHILFTLRDDAQGAVDDALAELSEKRRVALTVSHVLAVPALVARTNFLATISEQIAHRLGPGEGCQVLEPPIPLQPWTQRLIWNREADSNRLLKLVRDEIIAAGRPQKDDGKTA